MKLLTMTLAGLLPVRKIKAGIAMSCPVRECHVVFVGSESSHLNSSNQKRYEKKVSKCIWIQSLFSFTLNLSPCRHQCCLCRPCGLQPNNVNRVGIGIVFFELIDFFPKYFLSNLTLKGTVKLQTEA